MIPQLFDRAAADKHAHDGDYINANIQSNKSPEEDECLLAVAAGEDAHEEEADGDAGEGAGGEVWGSCGAGPFRGEGDGRGREVVHVAADAVGDGEDFEDHDDYGEELGGEC